MINPMVAWAICSPENQARWRARAMRLAVGYACYWTAEPAAIAELMPTEVRDQQLLLAVYHEALEQLASRPIDRVTGRDVWELVERRVTAAAPADMRAEALTVLAACSEHDVEPTRFAAVALEIGLDTSVAAHVAAMIVGVLAGQLDLVTHLAHIARELDPPDEGSPS